MEVVMKQKAKNYKVLSPYYRVESKLMVSHNHNALLSPYYRVESWFYGTVKNYA